MNNQAARLKPESDHWARVDGYGLWVRLKEVKGASARPLRQLLEQDAKAHLCRDVHCAHWSRHLRLDFIARLTQLWMPTAGLT